MKEELNITWLGINGFIFEYRDFTLLLDPCVTRGDAAELSEPALVKKYISCADAIVAGHSHWDHICDVPGIIRSTGAVLYGSETSCNIARYFGTPESNLHEVSYGEHVQLTPEISIDFLESVHMQPCSSDFSYSSIPEKIEKRSDFACGKVFAILLRIGNISILNIGSANLIPEALNGIVCDYLLCGVSLWKPGFPELVADNIDFKCFVPTHHDNFKEYPLTQFKLRDDFIRFRREMDVIKPGTEYMELFPLERTLLIEPNKRYMTATKGIAV